MLSIIQIAFNKFIGNIIALFLVSPESAVKIILEKENPEHGKHDEKLYQDNNPEFAAPRHGSEAFIIEEEYPAGNIHFSSTHSKLIRLNPL